jgi:hypothetical protein
MLRGFTYQAIGSLAQCQPQAFKGRTDIASQFFAALAVESPSIRGTVQEATNALASAFKGGRGEGSSPIAVNSTPLLPRIMKQARSKGISTDLP